MPEKSYLESFSSDTEGGMEKETMEDLARDLLQIQFRYSRQVSQLTSFLNASGEYSMLYYLYNCGTCCSAGELACQLGLTPGRVTNVLKALERKLLIKRKKDPADHRITKVTLTEPGRAYVAKGYQDAETIYKALIENIGEEDSRAYIRITKEILEYWKSAEHPDMED